MTNIYDSKHAETRWMLRDHWWVLNLVKRSILGFSTASHHHSIIVLVVTMWYVYSVFTEFHCTPFVREEINFSLHHFLGEEPCTAFTEHTAYKQTQTSKAFQIIGEESSSGEMNSNKNLLSCFTLTWGLEWEKIDHRNKTPVNSSRSACPMFCHQH